MWVVDIETAPEDDVTAALAPLEEDEDSAVTVPAPLHVTEDDDDEDDEAEVVGYAR